MGMTFDEANEIFRLHGVEMRIKYDQEWDVSYFVQKGKETYETREVFRKNDWLWNEGKEGWVLTNRKHMQNGGDFEPFVNEILCYLRKIPKTTDNSLQEKMKKFKDLSAKDKAYVAWRADPSLSSEDLAQIAGGEASVSKINSWRGGWLKNERIPSQAAWAVIEELEEQIEQLEEELEKNGKPNSQSILEKVTNERNSLMSAMEHFKTEIRSLELKLRDVENQKPRTKSIILVKPDGKRKIIKGNRHPAYEDVVVLASLRKNIFLPGPAGCGKSFLCQQVAQDLKLDFSFINCSAGMSEGHLLGRLLPVGEGGKFEYVVAEYVTRYENGGLFCADELDASDPNVLLVINTSISNGYMVLPNRPDKPHVERHKDFVFVGCANTYGRGNDRLYVGRNQLDEATLDRFRIGTVPMDYDSGEYKESPDYISPTIPFDFQNKAKSWGGIEKNLCPDDDLRVRLLWYRKKVIEAKLERIISTRFMIDAYDMKSKAKWSDQRIDEALFSGWTEDEINLVRGL